MRAGFRAGALLAATVLLAAGCGTAQPASTSTSTDGLVAIGAGLQGPAGLTATVAAQGPPNLAALAEDGEGRLWFSTAASDDAGADGVYVVTEPGAAPVEVISGLHTPLGLLWYGDALYVAALGGVERYSDFDGTQFGGHETIVAVTADVGESNGLVLAPDGRMLVGVSAPCDHCTPASPWSATILSFRPDGRDVQVFASGIRAPIGLAYDPGTSDLFVTMNQRDDLGAQTPGDWLSVVEEGEDWGFPDCYGQDSESCAGVPRPTAVLDAHAAVSGVAIVTGQLGAEVGTSALVAEWSQGKVQRVALETDGTTDAATVTPFLTGVRNPVGVLLAPDGALWVGDWTTGTIYRVARA